MSKGVPRFALLVAVVVGGCSKSDEGLTQRLMESNEKVVACQKELAGAKSEIANLKRQLADAVANPGKFALTDPDIIELVASRRNALAGKPGEVQPTLDPRQASKIVMQGATAMQACYERALKRNAALQMQSGLALTLGITVKPTGDVEAVDVAPSFDKGLTDCFRTTASHWKFPTFSGTAVTIEQKFKLTPKT